MSTTTVLSPPPKQFFEYNNEPAVGCRLFTYNAGTTTKVNTYTDSTGSTPNTNPIVLDARGECDCWLTPGTAYKFTLAPPGSDDPPTDPIWTVDQIVTQNQVNFATIAALRLNAVARPSPVFVQSYSSSSTGAKGAGFFDYVPGDTSSADNGGTIIVDAIGQRWYRVDGEKGVVWASWFGAALDGVTDDTSAIQSAINALVSSGGGKVMIDEGTAVVSETLSWTANNVWLCGVSRDASVLSTNSATVDVIAIGSSGAGPSQCYVTDLEITSSVGRTAGAAVRITRAIDCGVERVVLASNLYDGVVLMGGSGQFLYRLTDVAINSGHNGVVIGPDGNVVTDVFLSNIVAKNLTNVGVLVENCSGVYWNGGDISASAYGVSVSPGSGQTATSLFISNVSVETAAQQGWNFTVASSSVIADVSMVNCAALNGGTLTNHNGLLVDAAGGTITGMSLANFTSQGNTGNGMLITASGGTLQGVYIVNPAVSNNSNGSSGTDHGIAIGANTNNFSIIGGYCGTGGVDEPTNNQGYGILVNSGTSNHYVISGVNCNGNVTGGVSDGGSGTDKFVVNNLPTTPHTYTTGALTPTAGATGTITHNLGFNPNTVTAWLVCTTAQLNYSIGDIVPISINGSNGNSSNVQVASNPSSLNTSTYVIGSAGIGVLNKTGGGSTAINAGDWNLFIKLAA